MRTLALCLVLTATPAFVPRAVGQLPDPAPLSWSIRVDGPTTGKPGRFVELARNPDSWALGSFSGYPGRNLDYLLV
jgi:hypothetical protein